MVEQAAITLLETLIKKGVRIPCPSSVEIGTDIDPDRISGEGVTIHAGCKLFGADTLIMAGTQLGYEAPVTIHNCQLGRGVELGGGFFEDSCFLDRVTMGSGAQIREKCLLEEEARGGHTVGLKHTILFPFVTLGSLVNFCDCFMSGGTDKKNHSEVGSSYIHFNYTPHQDKATASLIGDVPNGVMLNQPPIFLGGQGGLVGPVRIGFGVTVGAGVIVRKDVLKENTLVLGQASPAKTMSFRPGLHVNLRRIIRTNIDYIANLIVLRRWYLDVRRMLIDQEPMEEALFDGAVHKLEGAISERIKRLGEVVDGISNNRELLERFPDMVGVLKESMAWEGEHGAREAFLKSVERAIHVHGRDYLRVIKELSPEEAHMATNWLEGLVGEITRCAREVIPGFKKEKV